MNRAFFGIVSSGAIDVAGGAGTRLSFRDPTYVRRLVSSSVTPEHPSAERIKCFAQFVVAHDGETELYEEQFRSPDFLTYRGE